MVQILHIYKTGQPQEILAGIEGTVKIFMRYNKVSGSENYVSKSYDFHGDQ